MKTNFESTEKFLVPLTNEPSLIEILYRLASLLLNGVFGKCNNEDSSGKRQLGPGAETVKRLIRSVGSETHVVNKAICPDLTRLETS